MDEFRLSADFREKLRRFQAVLLGIFFKIHIVQQSYQAPEIFIFAHFPGKIPHSALYGQAVEDMKRLPVVLLQQRQGLGACNLGSHIKSSFEASGEEGRLLALLPTF